MPADVKCSESVTSFKSRIDSFRLKGYKENKLGHFWELSYDIYDRVSTIQGQIGYVIYVVLKCLRL